MNGQMERDEWTDGLRDGWDHKLNVKLPPSRRWQITIASALAWPHMH